MLGTQCYCASSAFSVSTRDLYTRHTHTFVKGGNVTTVGWLVTLCQGMSRCNTNVQRQQQLEGQSKWQETINP